MKGSESPRRSFLIVLPWLVVMVAIGVHLMVDYPSRTARKKMAEEQANERRAVAEIQNLGGFTKYGQPPEFRVISVEFIAIGEVINGKAVIDEPKITDEGLVHLRALPRLQTLNLGGTKVTDAGLEYLKGLGSLETLNIRNTQVTDEGVKMLQEALPNCKIAR